jgi:hypothetical protein
LATRLCLKKPDHCLKIRDGDWFKFLKLET